MRTPPLLADFSHARACKPFCEKYLTLPDSFFQLREGTTKIDVQTKLQKKNSTPTPVGMEFSISEGDHEKLMDIAGFDITFAASGKGKHNLVVFI